MYVFFVFRHLQLWQVSPEFFWWGVYFNNLKNIHKCGSGIQRPLRTKERSWHKACDYHSVREAAGAPPGQSLV